MACRTHQLNKTTGITYVYESTSYWDPIKKQPRNKKVCIGKLDKDSGMFIPSKRLLDFRRFRYSISFHFSSIYQYLSRQYLSILI